MASRHASLTTISFCLLGKVRQANEPFNCKDVSCICLGRYNRMVKHNPNRNLLPADKDLYEIPPVTVIITCLTVSAL